MESYTAQLKTLLSQAGCQFERQGRGDHEIWFSPITLSRVSSPSVLHRFNKEETCRFCLMSLALKPVRTIKNGEKRIFDMSPYMKKKPFTQLDNSPLFTRAFIDYGTVVWPGNIDIAPETLYERSQPA